MNREKWFAFLNPFLGRALMALALCATLNATARLLPRDAAKDRALADALFTNGSLLHLKIEIPSNHIAGLGRSPRNYVNCTLREGEAVYTNVGIHLKGSAGSFRPITEKAGFTLNFSHFESNTNFHGLNKFHLNNSVQDPTFLSEWLCNELFRAAGVPAPFCAHAVVELNKRKLGLYVIKESNNRDFLARYFINTRGNLYGQPGHGDIFSALERMGGKGPLDRADLKALSVACREPDPAKRWERLQKNLDLERFLSFMALEVLLCDWDGYTAAQHNYRIYQDLDTGRMVFFPHDKDQVLGNPDHPFMPNSGSLAAQAVLNHPQGRQLYRERFRYVFTNVFKVPLLTARVDWMVGKLLPGLQAYDPNFARNFVNNANGLKARITARAQGLERQFQPPPPKPAVAALPAPKPAGPANTAAPKPAPPGRLDPIKAQWEPVHAQNASKLEILQPDNKPVLYIKSEETNCVAAWWTKLDLPPGKYRFSGRAKARGLAAHTTPLGAGGGLRVSGRDRKNILQGDQDWTTLQEEFNLDAAKPVRLLCELRANKGEIWFDLASLKVERVK